MVARFDREPAASGPVIAGFSGTGFRVGEAVHHRGLLITPDWVRGWDAPALEDLREGDLGALLETQPRPEFLLLGTGPTLSRPPAALIETLGARGIGIEPMDSRTAARTWNMLRGEDRWIVAALLPL